MRKRNYEGYLNDMVDDMYDLRSTIKKILDDEDISIAYIIGYIAALGGIVSCLVGAFAGLGLSFTALSPLVIGGVIGAIFPSLLALIPIGVRYYLRDEVNAIKRNEGIVKKCVIATLMAFFVPMAITSIAAGVGLAAVINAIFPGVFATWYSVAIGAGIGAITLLAGITVVAIIAEKFAGDLFEYIISDECVIGPQVSSVGLEFPAR